MIDSVLIVVGGHPVVVGLNSGNQGSPRGNAHRAVRIGAIETNSFVGKTIEVGSADDRMAGAAECVGAVLVGGNKEDIGFRHRKSFDLSGSS